MRKPASVLFAALLLVSAFFFGGRLESSDEVLMASTSKAIATRFSLAFEEPVHGQLFTGYGIGTPIVGVPFVFADMLLKAPDGRTTLPLANSLLFALTGLFSLLIVQRFAQGGEDGNAALKVGAVMIASPLLPASTTFYSEMLSAAALAGLIASVVCSGSGKRRWLAIAFFCGLFGVLARVAMVPLLGLVLVWGWRRRKTTGESGAMTLAAAGAAIGMVAWMAVNFVLRGSVFSTGYVGQDFTTPLATGLHGLLFSPERGLLVFFPAVAMLLAAGRHGGLRALALAMLAFTVVFHAAFWTWHGGGTMGPRFLLPAIAATVPLLALVLLRPETPVFAKRTLVALLLWSAWGSTLYGLFNPVTWWNETKPFHGVESRWLFEPQLSLWRNWEFLAGEGRFRALLPELAGGGVAFVFVVAIAFMTAVADAAFRSPGQRCATLRKPVAVGVALGVLVVAVGALRGPRGWVADDGELRPALRVSDESLRLTAIFDATVHRDYRLQSKASGTYRLTANGDTILQGSSTAPHLAEGVLPLAEPGPVILEAEFAPPDDGGWWHVFWTWPGEGRLMEPLGGEYLLPRELTASERSFTFLWRRGWILLAGGMALVLMLFPRGVAMASAGVEKP